jgi:protein ImuB
MSFSPSPVSFRIACLVAPDFALESLYRIEPALRDAPLALTDDTGPRATITAVSAAARRLGVRTGLTAAQGTAMCAALVFRTVARTDAAAENSGSQRASSPYRRARPIAVDYRRAAQAALCEVAASCSPRVEDPSDGNNRGYGTVYADVRGTPFPSEHALGAALTARAARVGLDVHVGIASTKMTAHLAAHHGAGVTVVAPGAERRFLAPLPITLLDPDPGLTATLIRWGITRLGELACLSPGGVGTRLGSAGAALVRCARGVDSTPLVPSPARPSFVEETELDYGVETLEPLAFVLRGCLDRLVARLALRSLACGELRLSLGLATHACEERHVTVAAPTTDVKVLLTLVRLQLEAEPPAAPVEAIRVTALPAHVRAAQLDLFRPAGPAPEHLATTVAHLAAICGPGRVGAPAVVDSHRPEALALTAFAPPEGAQERARVRPVSRSAATIAPPSHPVDACRLALRAIRPPRLVEVFDNQGRPDFVRGDRFGGRVVALAGPWRLAGEWWTDQRFVRDYYDMGLSDGGVYRIYRDAHTTQWFVEGEYD